MPTALLTATVPTASGTATADLRRDTDGAYRWYTGDADMEVSGSTPVYAARALIAAYGVDGDPLDLIGAALAVAAPATYDTYWQAILGSRSAEMVAAEFGLVADGLDEWLGTVEEAAISAGNLDRDATLAEWGALHGRALAELVAAVESLAAAASADDVPAQSFVVVVDDEDMAPGEMRDMVDDLQAAVDELEVAVRLADDDGAVTRPSVTYRTPRRGEATGTYRCRADGSLQILGYSLPVPEELRDLLDQAWEHACGAPAAE